MTMSHIEHRRAAPSSTRCFVVTISDTRTEDDDTGGRTIVQLLSAEGHDVDAKHCKYCGARL